MGCIISNLEAIPKLLVGPNTHKHIDNMRLLLQQKSVTVPINVNEKLNRFAGAVKACCSMYDCHHRQPELLVKLSSHQSELQNGPPTETPVPLPSAFFLKFCDS